MTTRFFRMSAIAVLALGASHTMLQAQEARAVEGNGGGLVGIWDVNVSVKDCQDGHTIRTVRSLQRFERDGTVTETAFTASRGMSLGVWSRTGGQTFNAVYWFFRFKTDGTFASTAKAPFDTITLAQDGMHFTSVSQIQDFDANNTLISTGCVTHSATRLTNPPQGD